MRARQRGGRGGADRERLAEGGDGMPDGALAQPAPIGGRQAVLPEVQIERLVAREGTRQQTAPIPRAASQ